MSSPDSVDKLFALSVLDGDRANHPFDFDVEEFSSIRGRHPYHLGHTHLELLMYLDEKGPVVGLEFADGIELNSDVVVRGSKDVGARSPPLKLSVVPRMALIIQELVA